MSTDRSQAYGPTYSVIIRCIEAIRNQIIYTVYTCFCNSSIAVYYLNASNLGFRSTLYNITLIRIIPLYTFQ